MLVYRCEQHSRRSTQDQLQSILLGSEETSRAPSLPAPARRSFTRSMPTPLATRPSESGIAAGMKPSDARCAKGGMSKHEAKHNCVPGAAVERQAQMAEETWQGINARRSPMAPRLARGADGANSIMPLRVSASSLLFSSNCHDRRPPSARLLTHLPSSLLRLRV